MLYKSIIVGTSVLETCDQSRAGVGMKQACCHGQMQALSRQVGLLLRLARGMPQHALPAGPELRWGCASLDCTPARPPCAARRAACSAAASVTLNVDGPAAASTSGTAEDLQFRAHIDWRFVRDNPERVRNNCRARNSAADPDAVVRLYERWRGLDEAAEDLRAARNANAKAAKVRCSVSRLWRVPGSAFRCQSHRPFSAQCQAPPFRPYQHQRRAKRLGSANP